MEEINGNSKVITIIYIINLKIYYKSLLIMPDKEMINYQEMGSLS